MQRVAVLSFHTSPLVQPGVGDGGGMNVYVRELVSALSHAGVDCTTYTRAWKPGLPAVVNIEPNHKVVHIPAGDFDIPKDSLSSMIPEFAFPAPTARAAHPLTATSEYKTNSAAP